MASYLGAALTSALCADAAVRARAEAALSEASEQPGFCAALLAASDPSAGLPEEARLLAATMLKNEAVRHWRRGAARDDEGPELRATLMQRLVVPEPSQRIGVQLALTIARIMRSEANTGEATVLDAFAQTLACAQLPGHALLALLYTAKELGSMRLPAQRRLAARVGAVMLQPIGPHWEASLRAALSAVGGDHEAVATATASAASLEERLHTAALHTKAVRRLLSLATLDGGDVATQEAGGASSPALAWQPAAACAFAVDAARQLLARPASVLPLGGGARSEWSRLGGAIGKLLVELYRSRILGSVPGVATVDVPANHQLLADVCTMILSEADLRHSLRLAAGPMVAHGLASAAVPVGTIGPELQSAAHALSELEARESFMSKLPAQLIGLVEHGLEDEEWLGAASSGVGALVNGTVKLMGRSVAQLAWWSADPEGFASDVLLPLEDIGDDEDDEEPGECGEGGGDESYVDEDGSGDDRGALASSDAGHAGGSAVERLRRAADALLAALLCAKPDEVGQALLALMPPAPCTSDEPFAMLVHRDSCYAALGIGAWQLQEALSFAQMLTAALREAEALMGTPHAKPTLRAALQARLCWLLSCWWAFGGSGDVAEDERLCDASYRFLCRQLSYGDAAVRLQASQVLRTLLEGAADSDVRVFEPHAAGAFGSLAAALSGCCTDSGCLCILKAMGALLRHAATAVHGSTAVGEAMLVLNALWQRAESEERVIVTKALRRVAAAMA
jgi:hypothetical protein